MTEVSQPKKSKRGILWGGGIVIAILVVLALIAFFVLDLRVVFDPMGKLEQAQATWQITGIEDYTLVARVEAAFRTSGVYEITVEGGEVIEAKLYSEPAFRYDPNATAFDVPNAQATAYSIESMFSRARRLVDDFDNVEIYLPGTSHVLYNAEYGYVETYLENNCGWLLDAVPECVTQIEIIQFEPR